MSDIPAPAADAAQKEEIIVPTTRSRSSASTLTPRWWGTKVQIFIKRPAFPQALANTVAWEAANVIESYITVMGERPPAGDRHAARCAVPGSRHGFG